MRRNKKRTPKDVIPHMSFWAGLGSVFNIAGNYYELGCKGNLEDDRHAINEDWRKVGNDFRKALGCGMENDTALHSPDLIMTVLKDIENERK